MPSYFLEFEALSSEPELERIFLSQGGSIAAAAARGSTDFAVSGARFAVNAELSDTQATTIRLKLEGATLSESQRNCVRMDNRSKLLIGSSREGAAINGSIVSTHSGAGSAYLSAALRTAASTHAAIPITYSAWKNHSSVVSASNFRIVDDDRRHYSIDFVDNPERDEALKLSENVMSQYANAAWGLRQSLVYKHSPSLTKVVGNQPVGINDSSFDLVHNIIEAPHSFYQDVTVESLLKNAILNELEFSDDEIDAFHEATFVPGLKAAMHGGRVVAGAMSTLASYLVSYRADGTTIVSPQGSTAVAAESWLRQAPRTPTDADDCDGSAIRVLNILGACTRGNYDPNLFPYMNAVKNVINPYYSPVISVLGARGAEASGGGTHASGEPEQLAGHAAALLIPSMDLLKALDRGTRAPIKGQAPEETDTDVSPDSVAEARFKAIFNADVVGSMGDEAEAAKLGNWKMAAVDADLAQLAPMAMEGTTPASPILFTTGEKATNACVNTRADQQVFDKVGPTVGRAIKILYVCDKYYTNGSSGEEPAYTQHKFYHDFVEVSVGRSHPLWKDAEVRRLGAATSQLVLSATPDAKAPIPASAPLASAGVSPRDLVLRNYAATPLAVLDEQTSKLMDYASEVADLDVMPPRAPQKVSLTDFQTTQLEKSLQHLEDLHTHFETGEDAGDGGHAVAYVFAYSTLANNPDAIGHFCERIKAEARTGIVDSLDVDGLVYNAKKQPAGKMVIVNVVV